MTYNFNNLTKRLRFITFADKSRFIDRLNISDEKKKYYKEFFKKYNTLDSKIDWNKKDDLEKDIDRLIQETKDKQDSKSKKSAMYKEISKGNKDCRFLYENDNWEFYQVMSHKGAVYADSSNIGGKPAKWCIGTKDDSNYWNRYSFDDNSLFVLAIAKKGKSNLDDTKYMIQLIGANS